MSVPVLLKNLKVFIITCSITGFEKKHSLLFFVDAQAMCARALRAVLGQYETINTDQACSIALRLMPPKVASQLDEFERKVIACLPITLPVGRVACSYVAG